jgi:hypothetical protein
MDHTAKGGGMDTVRRYPMLIDGDWIDTGDRFEIRAYPLLLSTPPG